MFYFASFLLFVSLGLVGHGIYLSFFTSRRIRGRSMVNFGCFSMIVFSIIAVIFQP